MNPILLRYVGFMLAAAIAGAGGGYLAVSKKVFPPSVTQSGTIPAIPAQPFPGEGIPAIQAIPAIPNNHPIPPRGDAPTLSSLPFTKCSSFQATPKDAYCLVPTDFGDGPNTQTNVTLAGYNFTKANNAVKWDGAVIGRLFSTDDGTKISFLTPSGQQACSLHDVSVTTVYGTSNNLQVKIIDPFTGFLPLWFLSIKNTGGYLTSSASVGEEIDLSISIPEDPKYYSLDIYAQFSKYDSDKKFLWAGEAMTPLTAVKLPENYDLGGNAVYRLKIPQEVNRCPVDIYPGCESSKYADQVIPITPGSYGIKITTVAKGQCSTRVDAGSVGFHAFTIK